MHYCMFNLIGTLVGFEPDGIQYTEHHDGLTNFLFFFCIFHDFSTTTTQNNIMDQDKHNVMFTCNSRLNRGKKWMDSIDIRPFTM